MTVTSPTADEQTICEVAAHAILELVATHPGQFGRLRTARLVGGFSVPLDDAAASSTLPLRGVVTGWSISEAVALVDALLSGGLLAQTVGMRPTLVLTRAGHRALTALEDAPAPPPQ